MEAPTLRVEVKLEDGEDADDAKTRILQPYIDAQREYARLTGRCLYDISITAEQDGSIGEVPIISVRKEAFDTTQGYHFTPYREYAIIDQDGRRVRTEKQISSDIHKLRRFEHDKMEDYLARKRNFVAVDARINEIIKKEKFVNPSKEAEVLKKIRAKAEEDFDIQEAAVQAAVAKDE